MKSTLKDILQTMRGLKCDREVWDTVIDFLSQFVGTPDVEPTKAINVADYGVVPQSRIEAIIKKIRDESIAPIDENINRLNNVAVEVESGEKEQCQPEEEAGTKAPAKAPKAKPVRRVRTTRKKGG